MLPSDQKTCTKCGQPKPLSRFAKDKYKPDGKRPICKDCDKERRDAQPPLTDDQRAAQHANRIAYYQDNRQAALENARRWAEQHPDEYQQYHQQYYQATRTDQLAAGRLRRQANLAHIRAHDRMRQKRDKAKFNVRRRLWAQRNRGRILSYYHKRRAAKLGGGGTHTLAEWEAMLDWFGRCCLACGRPDRLTRDHVIPLTLGGPDVIANIQPLCHWCNSAKGQQTTDFRYPAALAAFLASLP